MTTRLDGRVAAITAAGQGIGAASARIMAAQGATVFVGDIDGARAAAQADRIVAAGGTAAAMAFDARDKGSIQAFVHTAHATFGRLDILHNNAGGSDPRRDVQAVDIDDDTWREIFAWNIDSAHWATQAAIPLMLETGAGSIVNTITGGASVALSTRTAYGTAKAALASYTRYVAVQYGRRGIRCNGISPGFIVTPYAVEQLPPAFRETVLEHATTVRAGIPDDIGHLAAFLASDAAGFINGAVIPVDGGGHARSSNDARALAIGSYGAGHPIPDGLPRLP